MSYKVQYGAAIVVGLALLALGAMQAAGPGVLEISAKTMAWLGVLTAVLGGVQSFLPRLNVTPENRREAFEAAVNGNQVPTDLEGNVGAGGRPSPS